uniref:NADH-ubiquinone oxidoreductase chain 2 n=1 Tax=Attagenus hottentotus TaxID=1205591 RepID=A0A0S2MRU0_9COLE|nr:NADH deshydrogenase subunit 2 [Attagenus hottentotus]
MFILTLVAGTLITVSSNSWLGMWMGLEINLLSIIPLMESVKNQSESEASMKYFITQAIASSILMLAIIMIMQESMMSSTKSTIMNTAILTKMGAAPFHFWFPEVIEGLSWFNSLIMLTWQKIAPMVIMMYSNKTMMFLTASIIASMMISGIMGINQTSLRKIMAYSSINHIGWMISSTLMIQSIWMLYLVIYSIISMAIIMIMKFNNTFKMNQLTTTLNESKSMKMLFILNFLSLGGIPPFLGFFPKWITINFLIENKFTMMTFLMILMTLMTLYFYMRITFSSLILMTSETVTKIKMNNKSFMIMTLNIILLSSLMMCTMTLNFV